MVENLTEYENCLINYNNELVELKERSFKDVPQDTFDEFVNGYKKCASKAFVEELVKTGNITSIGTESSTIKISDIVSIVDRSIELKGKNYDFKLLQDICNKIYSYENMVKYTKRLIDTENIKLERIEN